MITKTSPTKPILVHLPRKAHKALKLCALKRDTTISDLVRKALERCYGVAA